MKKLTRTELGNRQLFTITSAGAISMYLLDNFRRHLDDFQVEFLTTMLGYERTQGRQSAVLKEICVRMDVDISEFIQYQTEH